MKTALTLMIAAGYGVAGAQAQLPAPGTTAADLLQRDPAIHWPAAFDPATAALFSHNELLIHAGCHRVWVRLTDVSDWPNQVVFLKDVKIDGGAQTIAEGTGLHLTIFNTPITAHITEFAPDSRLSWLPAALTEAKAQHFHTWHLTPEVGGCRVVTEEAGISAQDATLTKRGDTFMHRAHDLWLASLKWTSEQ